ncbi:MAG: Flp family type IVb pilin [Pseudomonadota bacterium]
MSTFISAVKNFSQDEDGITAIEYGLIAALMAAVVATAFALIGPAMKTLFENIRDTLVA